MEGTAGDGNGRRGVKCNEGDWTAPAGMRPSGGRKSLLPLSLAFGDTITMTCTEFQRIVKTVNPADVTRAVRAAVIHHGKTCPACGPDFKRGLGVLTPALIKMTNEDVQDPEYRNVVLGEE